MQLGIFAKTFDGLDPLTVLTAAKAAGYSCAQYNMACSGLPSMPDAISFDAARAVAEASRLTGVEIAAVSGTYNMIHPDPAARQLGQRRLEVLAAHCAEMGTRLITLCTGTRDPVDQWKEHPDNNTPEAWRDLLDAMETAIGIAERYDVDLGVEPELANVVNSAQKARQLIDELKSPRIKIVFDPANLFEVTTAEVQREVVAEAIDLLANRISIAHAKDRCSNGRFTAAGNGVLDYPHYLRSLLEIGFSGSLITHGLPKDDAGNVAQFLGNVLDEFEQ